MMVLYHHVVFDSVLTHHTHTHALKKKKGQQIDSGMLVHNSKGLFTLVCLVFFTLFFGIVNPQMCGNLLFSIPSYRNGNMRGKKPTNSNT